MCCIQARGKTRQGQNLLSALYRSQNSGGNKNRDLNRSECVEAPTTRICSFCCFFLGGGGPDDTSTDYCTYCTSF
jgi:hypothetical protein